MKNQTMQNKRKNAAIYIRVSTGKQAKKGTSLDTQEKKCAAYAKHLGYNVVRIFREEGESAKVWQRPILVSLLGWLQKNKKVDVLIVYKLDRLSRNTDDQHAIMYKLQQAGVDLRSATENIDDTAVGKFVRSMLWAIAEFDNAIRSERTRSGQLARFQDGYWPFAPPTGYVVGKEAGTDNYLPVPHPEYGSLITWAAKQRAAGVPYMTIAADLKKRGFRTRQGNTPSGQYVFKVLHNKFFIGMMKAFGEEKKGKHEALISYDVWLKMRVVDGEATNPATQRQKYNPEFPLANNLTCPDCGMKLRGSYSKGKLGKRYPYYHHYNAQCARSRSYTRAVVHDDFMATLQKLKPTKSHLKLFKAVILDVAKRKGAEQASVVSRFDQRIKELRRKRERIIDQMLEDAEQVILSREEYLARKSKIENDIEEVETERAKHVRTEIDVQRYLDRCFAAITDPAERWQSYKKIEHKIEFTRELFPGGVQYDGEKCRTPEISPLIQVLSQYPTTDEELVGVS